MPVNHTEKRDEWFAALNNHIERAFMRKAQVLQL